MKPFAGGSGRVSLVIAVLALAVAAMSCGAADSGVVADQSTRVGSSAPAMATTTTVIFRPRARCTRMAFAAEASAIADHASTAEAAVKAWLDGRFDQSTFGPIQLDNPASGPPGQEMRYGLTQGGQPIGDVEVRHDSGGFYVFSSHTCGEWEAPGTTIAGPGATSAR